MYKIFFKRLVDIALSLILLFITAIPMLICAILIKISDIKSPVIFKQERVGLNYQSFIIYKFRSMKTTAPKNVASNDLTDSHQHITKVGMILRKTSLDELPQLFNILKGDMSFVGYRPVITTEYELNNLRKDLGVFSVRPGITGLAQISGRDNVDCKTKAKLDAYYAKNISIFLDMKIFFGTIPAVIKQDGIKESRKIINNDK